MAGVKKEAVFYTIWSKHEGKTTRQVKKAVSRSRCNTATEVNAGKSKRNDYTLIRTIKDMYLSWSQDTRNTAWKQQNCRQIKGQPCVTGKKTQNSNKVKINGKEWWVKKRISEEYRGVILSIWSRHTGLVMWSVCWT